MSINEKVNPSLEKISIFLTCILLAHIYKCFMDGSMASH